MFQTTFPPTCPGTAGGKYIDCVAPRIQRGARANLQLNLLYKRKIKMYKQANK